MTRIHAAAVLCALLAASPAAQTIDHLTIVAPAAPGGGWDQTARALQHVVDAHHLARVVEVQNVPGAAGTIGLSQFADAQRGNGRALLVTGLVMVGATLWNDSPVSVNQATPIARLTGEYEVIAVPASSPLGDLRALIDEFRRRPEAFAWGGGSAGGTDHILAGLVAEAAGVDPRRVNYVAFSGGGEAVAALIGGHVAAGISGYSEFAAHIASGRLRALAISSPVSTARYRGSHHSRGRARRRDVELARPARASRHRRRRPRGAGGARPRGGPDRRLAPAARGARVERSVSGRRGLRRLSARPSRPAMRRSWRVCAARRAANPSLVGRRIVPATVLAGGAMILLLLVTRRLRAREAAPGGLPRAKCFRSCTALAAFLLLLAPLGFVGASTAMFIIVARAFGRLRSDGTPAASPRPYVTVLIVAPAFCLLVYFAFTRGLDLPLPEARLWSWMR